ncbi:MAG: MCP four helix bundle domain-containing protein, partial [Rhodospirillaceae bacterium]|nr:MCP four helix bundle domain-containing protein [Rhodospirillaceae bacterium]
MAATPKSNLRIGQRLWLGFSILCGVIAVVTGIVVYEARGVDVASDRMIGFRMPVAQTSTAIESEMYASLAALRGYLLTGKDSFKQERADAWDELGAHIVTMDKLAPRFTNPRNIESWREAKSLLGELKA